ncbi:MAG: tail fiber domain-containing protein [Gemmatimonadota bacterium]|nr:MAG: tail fiber domain-containing protein [Gemmatimonadota bacterium]
MKKTMCLAAVIAMCFVITIFARSGEDTKGTGKGIQTPQLEASLATVPEYINFQGVLTDTSGAVVPDDNYPVTFRLYDEVETLRYAIFDIWIETHGGIFNTVLPIPPSVFDGSIFYLGVEVYNDGEMIPRYPIVSVPYSYLSGDGGGGPDDDWRAVGGGDPTVSGDIYHKGNVGIGTTSPDAELEVYSTGEPDIRLNRPSNTYAAVLQFYTDGERDWEICTPSGGDDLYIYRGFDQVVQSFLTNGNVGIGTRDPGGHRFYVTSDGSGVPGATSLIQNTNENGLGMIVEATSTDLPLLVSQKGEGDVFRCDSWTGGWHPVFVIENDGSVGIGNADPTAKLDVAGNIAIGWGCSLMVNESWPTGNSCILRNGWDVARGDFVEFYVPGEGESNEGAKMTITESGASVSGNLGVCVDEHIAMHVIAGLPVLLGPLPTVDVGIWTQSHDVGLWSQADYAGYFLGKTYLADSVGIGTDKPEYMLDVTGSAHASSFPTSSDARFKTNVTQLTNVLERLERIRGVSFEWNELYESLGRSTGSREIGLIAQEVEAVFPELVTSWGNEEYRAVDYGRFTGVLIEAVKELKAVNEALKQRVESLDATR